MGSFAGGDAPPASLVEGGGNLDRLFTAAADLWEHAIHDPVEVQIFFAWAPLGGNLLGEAVGSLVVFDNDSTSWFLDPTPGDDAEWTTEHETFADLGAGSMNVGRFWTGAEGAARSRFDLFSVVLHEVGHILGLGGGPAFDAETVDGDIDITAPRPFAGASLPTTTTGGGHLDLPEALMNPFIAPSRRVLPSAADILGVAQLQGYADLDLHPARVPEPEPALLVTLGLLVLAASSRRRAWAPAWQQSAPARSRRNAHKPVS